MIVSGDCVSHLRLLVEFLLRGPAHIHAFQTPLDALAFANRFVIDDHEHGVAVRRREDAKCDPTAVIDGHVEIERLQLAVGQDFLPRDGLAVDDDVALARLDENAGDRAFAPAARARRKRSVSSGL